MPLEAIVVVAGLISNLVTFVAFVNKGMRMRRKGVGAWTGANRRFTENISARRTGDAGTFTTTVFGGVAA